MSRQTFVKLLVVSLCVLPYLFPQGVEARNKRLQYENAAYRYKRSSGSDCIGRTCMIEAGFLKEPAYKSGDLVAIVNGQVVKDCGGTAGCTLMTWTQLAETNAFVNGYYIASEPNPDIPGAFRPTYFYLGVLPGGGNSSEGPGGSSSTPVIVGVVRARARELASAPTSCSDVYAGTTYVNTSISISPQGAPSGAQTASSGNYASWAVFPGTETVSAVPPANYILKMACWQGENPTASGTGLSAAVVGNQTVTWDLAYTNGTSWPQVIGGDVYAFDTVASYIPTTAVPRRFVLDGTGGKPGVVTYGVNSDFDVGTGGTGASYVSSSNWLAKDNYPRTDYYQLFYRRFGAPTTVNFTNETITQSQATSSATPYYATGDITTSGNWVIDDGETLVILVNGNLTIGGKIQTNGTGFVAFIVNGNITVAPSVGSAYNSTTSALEGVYITSPNGVFSTGLSTVSGSERFVGSGIFVAGEFQNQRDLSDIGGTNYNNTYAAELYNYDPQLLITMPNAMKDGNIVWQEVAP